MDIMHAGGRDIEIISANTVVVGAGAAALNAADRLHAYGAKDVIIVCEDFAASTSRNTVSARVSW